MGTYRLILALAVLLSHAGVTINGFNQGVAAVISFLLISGMVITGMINKRFEGKDSILRFYADRALRIYPQYLFYVFISLLCGAFILNEHYGLTRILVNALNLPLNFFVNINTNFLMILPSWSLALELQFYILIPWLIFYKKMKLATYASLFF
nr:acyltransferase [Pantoea agglomerans]